ncbi:hypothetical protein PAHAL_2G376400 [Panicum hallii]|uniref:F-box domain-containing protein n=1 Tax=Panicum hallii TaxID=206008 RepID=A0A2T8KRT7_9POAL|nr:hypothetical protein PAHAL_2G376400 [Panicum hallii]
MAEVAQRSGPPPSWSDIPLDLAGHLLRLLPACADRARFAAVCPQWRAAAGRAPGRHLLQPPLRQALPLPWLWLRRLQDRRLWQLACLPARRRLLLGRSLRGGDGGAACSVSRPAASPNAVAKYTTVEGAMGRLCHPYVTWMHLKDMENVPMIRKLILCSPNLVAAFVGIERPSQILVCQPGASSWSVRATSLKTWLSIRKSCTPFLIMRTSLS